MDNKAKVSENRGVASVPVGAGSELAHIEAVGGCDDMTTPASKRSTSPAFQFYPNDFLGSTKVQQMSATEVGAYLLLLCACWLDGSIPSDTARLARIARMKEAQFTRMWSHLLKECFTERGDRFINSRLESERKKQTEYRKRQKDKADKRWESHGNATALPGTGTRHASGNALQSSSSSSSSSPPNGGRRAPLIDQREHRNHAQCGRVCLHASLFGEFVRRRNHDQADREIRDWALGVETDWSIGTHQHHEPGEPFAFWRARYDEQWPAAPKVDPRVPQWAR
jgi:uncharacterized protein YdaU (DUF1376 family)